MSELNTCKFCGGDMLNCGAPIWENYCPNDECTPLYKKEFFSKLKTKTCGTPSADTLAGLQTYGEGEYVLYSEAAAVIAEMQNKLSALSSALTDQTNDFISMSERAKAAEAELAKIKAQEPVAYLWQHPNHENDFSLAENGACLTDDDKKYGWLEIPLYASPVSDSLREASTKLAKFCEWYDSVDELGAIPDIQDVMVPLGDLRKVRAALKGDSNDKG